MKKINRKMQTCKAVADGASEVLDGLAKQGIIDSYIVSCCTTTSTADGGTDYDSGSVTRGDTDAPCQDDELHYLQHRRAKGSSDCGNHPADREYRRADKKWSRIQCQTVRVGEA